MNAKTNPNTHTRAAQRNQVTTWCSAARLKPNNAHRHPSVRNTSDQLNMSSPLPVSRSAKGSETKRRAQTQTAAGSLPGTGHTDSLLLQLGSLQTLGLPSG